MRRARAARCDLAWFEGLARRYAAQEVQTRQVLAPAEAADDHETTLVALSSLFAAAAIRGNFDGAWSASRRLIETAKITEFRVESRSAWRSRRRVWRWPVSSTMPAACST